MHKVFLQLGDLKDVGEGVFVNDTHMLKVYQKNALKDMEALEGTIKSLTGKTPDLRLDFCKQEHIGVVYEGKFKNP